MSVNIINPYNVKLNNVIIRGIGTLKSGEQSEIRDLTVLEVGGGTVSLGYRSVIGYGSFLQAKGDITIGDNSLLGPHCSYFASSHTTKRGYNVRDLPFLRGKITIKDNVWIGSNCTINKDIVLNNGCVIGANSFVNKSVPEWEVWGGTPVKFLKEVE